MTDALKKMNQDGRSLEDIAALVSVTLNAIHPWEDANGRTTRLAHSLLANGYTKNNQNRISNLMSEDGRELLGTDFRSIDWDLRSLLKREHPLDFRNLFSEVTTKQFKFTADVADYQKIDIIKAFRADASSELAIAVSDYLKNRTDKDLFYRDYPNDIKVVMLDSLIPTLSGKDIDDILSRYWQLKKRKVELLIDCIENPDKSDYRTKSKSGGTISFLEKLKASIKS